ncbi:3-phosphoglycerate dehydrogenase, partial [Nonomuraea sp. NPDC055795]
MTPWNLLALPPLPEELLRGLLTPLGDRVRLSVPARRDRAAMLDALPEARIGSGTSRCSMAARRRAQAAAMPS